MQGCVYACLLGVYVCTLIEIGDCRAVVLGRGCWVLVGWVGPRGVYSVACTDAMVETGEVGLSLWLFHLLLLTFLSLERTRLAEEKGFGRKSIVIEQPNAELGTNCRAEQSRSREWQNVIHGMSHAGCRCRCL